MLTGVRCNRLIQGLELAPDDLAFVSRFPRESDVDSRVRYVAQRDLQVVPQEVVQGVNA